jgi:hypothetical protein
MYTRRSQDLDMPPDLLADIADIAGDLTQMATTMRNVLHLALSISPILLLVPKKFSTVAIRRDHLIAVSQPTTLAELIEPAHSML